MKELLLMTKKLRFLRFPRL
uniref:Putative LRR receptor-like serine/threonine-protein kinase n=1 Tax=Rhizophora mucronata TaxID=61149 RepID=A0A2P2KUQ3_RHIMU